MRNRRECEILYAVWTAVLLYCDCSWLIYILSYIDLRLGFLIDNGESAYSRVGCSLKTQLLF